MKTDQFHNIRYNVAAGSFDSGSAWLEDVCEEVVRSMSAMTSDNSHFSNSTKNSLRVASGKAARYLGYEFGQTGLMLFPHNRTYVSLDVTFTFSRP